MLTYISTVELTPTQDPASDPSNYSKVCASGDIQLCGNMFTKCNPVTMYMTVL